MSSIDSSNIEISFDEFIYNAIGKDSRYKNWEIFYKETPFLFYFTRESIPKSWFLLSDTDTLPK